MADVLITGASRGIGFALTREYLKRGARVFAGVRDPENASALHALAADGLVIVPLDVRSQRDIEDAADVIASHGGLDRLVNNAGVLEPSSGLAEVDGPRMLEVLRVNTVGPMLMARRFLNLLRPDARLVNLTMPTRPIGSLTRTENHAFVASRYALNALTKMIAVEVADTGPIVAALWPGYLQTDMTGHAEKATPLEAAIPGVVDLIERLGPADHGSCLLPDGSHAPW
ncbi:SDR family NAD(P)-dependent oxidoreductase [Glycomyces rhizosphaerae]|uniref:SDR family NAD(P)-dependent oxidoreductase n=1 Tax=Glycomyces rhizosphaerae TaxID=2054422 RepID=A0ABV7Q299_9ACTN